MKQIVIAAVCVCVALNICRAGTDDLLNKLNPDGRLSDFAQVFDAAQKKACVGYLAEIGAQTAAQVAVVTLPSLEGAEIDDFASRLFQKWGIGDKKKDNGIMVLVVLQDRKARIEVGYGLEGVIPDAKAGRIIDEVMLPCFRQQRYAEGIIQVVATIGGIVAQSAGVALTNMPAPAVVPGIDTGIVAGAAAGAGPEHAASAVELAFFGFFIAIFLFFVVWAIVKGKGRPGKGSGSGGGSSGGGSSGDSGFGGGSSGGGGASRGW